MSGKPSDIARLLHIQDAIQSITTYIGSITEQEFLASPMLRDAVVRQCEIIGEASRYLSQELKDQYPHIEWQELTDFRNVLIHQYFGVNFKIVWQATQSTFPVLLESVQALLRDLTGE